MDDKINEQNNIQNSNEQSITNIQTTSKTTSYTAIANTNNNFNQRNNNDPLISIDPEMKQLHIGRIANQEEMQHFNSINLSLKDITTEYKSLINTILATLKGSGGNDINDNADDSSGGGMGLSPQDELLDLIQNFMKDVVICEKASNTNSDRLINIINNKQTIQQNKTLMNTYKNQLVKQYKEVKKLEHEQVNRKTLGQK